MKEHSSRAAIAPFLAMDVAREASALAAAGRSIVRFDVGQPHKGASPKACAAAAAAMGRESLGYTDALGAPALRSAIARHYGDTYRLDIAPERIIVTTGASAAFQLAFLAAFETADAVAMASPGYPPYRHILSALGMRARLAEGQAGDRFQLTPSHLDALAREGPLAGALVASPANPTGAMLDAGALAALAETSAAHGLTLICDEIYHGLAYETPAPSVLAAAPDAIVINSFSKYWAMTGWRVGWIVAPERLVRPIERLAQNLFISAPAISQVAALAALADRDWCETLRAEYAANRAAVLAATGKLALRLVAPADGAFYALLDITAHSRDSLAFAHAALHEAGVALTPGVDFDEARGATWVRLAFARSGAEVSEGLRRLAAWLGR
jgi:aspartate/methionine/tyrosine aminotransferase